jgi:hypothetical protein
MEIITQAEAKKRGLERYHHSKPCKRGHTERYTNSHTCVECARTRSARQSAAKPAKSAPAAVAAPAAYEPEKTLHRDPGQRISQARIDACIDRIYGGAPRLGAAALAASEAA